MVMDLRDGGRDVGTSGRVRPGLTYTLTVIYYIMNYITKPEMMLHSKLTIATIVRKKLASSKPTCSDDIGHNILLKICNKIDCNRWDRSLRSKISLRVPDHYIDAIFEKHPHHAPTPKHIPNTWNTGHHYRKNQRWTRHSNPHLQSSLCARFVPRRLCHRTASQ